MISQQFIIAVKLSPRRNYEIAHAASLHPSMLSKIMIGAERVKPQDPRVLRVAQILGLQPADCFKAEDGQRAVGAEGADNDRGVHPMATTTP